MEDRLYHYRAHVVRVYDGDTLTADIDLGLNAWLKGEKVRLIRINAPEIRGASRPQGLVSRDYLRQLVLDKEVVLATTKDKKGKYGRYLAEVWLKQGLEWVNINDLMVEQGQAEYHDYG